MPETTPKPIIDAKAMIKGMRPGLLAGDVVFCTCDNAALVARALPDARGLFREAEGVSLILSVERADALGFDIGQPMRQITLGVFSALEGVGLTAAVAGALAVLGIPCNMVAGYHHDHAFVPADRADQAMECLKTLASGA